MSPRLSDAEQRSLRGQRCAECGHAKAAHNDLDYCQRKGCSCGDWRVREVPREMNA